MTIYFTCLFYYFFVIFTLLPQLFIFSKHKKALLSFLYHHNINIRKNLLCLFFEFSLFLAFWLWFIFFCYLYFCHKLCYIFFCFLLGALSLWYVGALNTYTNINTFLRACCGSRSNATLSTMKIKLIYDLSTHSLSHSLIRRSERRRR